MSKIYSRPRIDLNRYLFINNEKRDNKKKRRRGYLFLIIIIAIITVKIILNSVTPIFYNLCDNKAKSVATLVSNEQATIVMKEHPYEDFFSVEKDSNGNITMIKSNVSFINEVISDIAVKIQTEINSKGRDDVKIALGSFSGFPLLANRGPYVNIKISTIGNVETDLKSEFTARGINQTLHRVYLVVDCEVSILTPFKNTIENITNQVLIAENVIVGNIPNTYYNLDGLNREDGIEIIE